MVYIHYVQAWHFVCLGIYESTCFLITSVCLSVRLSVCPSVRLSVCPSFRLSVCPSVRLSVCPSVIMSACPSVCLSICLSVCLCPFLFVFSSAPSIQLSVFSGTWCVLWKWPGGTTAKYTEGMKSEQTQQTYQTHQTHHP